MQILTQEFWTEAWKSAFLTSYLEKPLEWQELKNSLSLNNCIHSDSEPDAPGLGLGKAAGFGFQWLLKISLFLNQGLETIAADKIEDHSGHRGGVICGGGWRADAGIQRI